NTLQRAAQRIAAAYGKAGARLRVVLQQAELLVTQVEPLPGEDFELLGLVEVVLARVNGKAELDGPVEQIRLGEAEEQVALPIAHVRLDGQRFTKAQEVVGLVIE